MRSGSVWFLGLSVWVAFAQVTSTEPLDSVESYVETYVPEDFVEQITKDGIPVQWKSIKGKDYTNAGKMFLSVDFQNVLLRFEPPRATPKTVKLSKVHEVFQGPASNVVGKAKKLMGPRSFTLYTGKRQSAGTDFVASDLENAKKLSRVLDGVVSYLRGKPKPIEIDKDPLKKYKTEEEFVKAKKAFHEELRDDDKWLKEKTDRLAAEAKAEKRRLRKLREKQARDRDEGEYNLRRLMIKIDYAIRDGEDTFPIAQELAKACERSKKSESGWHETSVVYPNAVQRAIDHGAPPYDEEAEVERLRLDKVRRYQDAVIQLDKVLAGKVNVTHPQRIGINRLFANKTFKDEVLATMMEGQNVTMNDLLEHIEEDTTSPPQHEGEANMEVAAEGDNKMEVVENEVVDEAEQGVETDEAPEESQGVDVAEAAEAAEKAQEGQEAPNAHEAQIVEEVRVAEEGEGSMVTEANSLSHLEHEPSGSVNLRQAESSARAPSQQKTAGTSTATERTVLPADRDINSTREQEVGTQSENKKHAGDDPPPSKCAAALGHAMILARRAVSLEGVRLIEEAIETAGDCAVSAGDVDIWLDAARAMLAELQPTAPAAQACAKGGSCSRGDSEDPAVLLGEQPKAKNSEPPVVKDKRNTPPLKLNSRQLRNLKSKLRSLVARKAPGKLTKVNRWIKNIENGKLTVEALNDDLENTMKETIDLSKL